MSDHDASDYLLENSRLNLRRALAMVEQLRKDNEQLRAALAARPQPDENECGPYCGVCGGRPADRRWIRARERCACTCHEALAGSATPTVTLDYDNGYKQGFRDGLHQQGYDVDRLIAEAAADSAAPTGDDDE